MQTLRMLNTAKQKKQIEQWSNISPDKDAFVHDHLKHWVHIVTTLADYQSQMQCAAEILTLILHIPYEDATFLLFGE